MQSYTKPHTDFKNFVVSYGFFNNYFLNHLNIIMFLTLSLRHHLNNAPSCYTEHYKI